MEILQFIQCPEELDASDGAKSEYIDQDFIVFSKEYRKKKRPLPSIASQEDATVSGKSIFPFSKDPFLSVHRMKTAQTKWNNKVDESYRDVREKLFSSLDMKENALKTLESCVETFHGMDVKLHDKRACDINTGKTILHESIEKKKWLIANYLLAIDDNFRLLMKSYPFTMGGFVTEKTCLFILVEKHGRLKKPVSKRNIFTFLDSFTDKILIWAKKSKENMHKLKVFVNEPSGFKGKAGGTTDLTPLHVACYYGDIIIAKLLLSLHADVNAVNRRGETPLMWAMLGPEANSVTTLLIDYKADTNHVANDGSLALHWAIRSNNIAVVLQLLSNKSTVERMVNWPKKKGFQYPLIQACACGFHTVADCLLRSGADMKNSNHGGQNALHYAAAAGNIECIKVLLKHNKKSVDKEDKVGNTALMFAINGNHLPTVQLLVQEGANIYKQNQLGETAWSLALELSGNDILRKLVEQHNTKTFADGTVRMSPLQIAAKKNKIDKLAFLLTLVNRSEIDSKQRNTFLHVAAQENMAGLIRHVLLVDDPLIHARNCNQDTPLHLATKFGHVEVVELLLANATRREEMSERNVARRTPLHESVSANCPRMTQLFLASMRTGSDDDDDEDKDTDGAGHLTAMVDDVDEQGNTCLHLAVARNNSAELIFELLRHTRKVNVQNFEGNTALHVAAQEGNEEAVSQLLSQKTISLGLRNSRGRTALHVAILAPDTKFSLSVIQKLVEAIRLNRPDISKYKDMNGDSALHLACRSDRIDVIRLLVGHGYSPNVINEDGDSPLHVSNFRQKKSLTEALELFQGLNLDQENFNGETFLEICCKGGLKDHITALVNSGADLGHINSRRETVLHTLVRQTVLEPSKIQEYNEVYMAICDSAVTWWCNKHDLKCPSHHEAYAKLKTYVILYLTSELKDENGLSVVNLAVFIGAKDILQKIIRTPDVYLIKSSVDGCKLMQFNVTGLCHDSCTTEQDETFSSGAGDGMERRAGICSLDVLAEMKDVSTAVEMMKVSPFTEMVDHYWRAFQWLTLHLMLLHVIFMAVFSFSVTPVFTPDFFNTTISLARGYQTRDFVFTLFIPWPFIIMGIQLGYSSWRFPFCKSKNAHQNTPNLVVLGNDDMVHKVKGLFYWIYDSTNLFASIAFPLAMCLWYGMYLYRARVAAHMTTVVVLIGWLLAISFTLGVKGVHTFCEMFRYIMIRDIARFMCIYFFVLCAFLFSLHTMFQVVPELNTRFESAWDTLFLLFNLMVGVGELFDPSIEEAFKKSGFSSNYPKVLYTTYVMLSMIIMLNLLIAMVNETYESVKSREGTTWRRSTVLFAVRIEREFQFLKAFFKFRYIGCLKDYARKEVRTLTLKSKQGHLKSISWTHYIMDVYKDTRKHNELDDDQRFDQKDVCLQEMRDNIDNLDKKIDQKLQSIDQINRDLTILKDMIGNIWLQQSVGQQNVCGSSIRQESNTTQSNIRARQDAFSQQDIDLSTTLDKL